MIRTRIALDADLPERKTIRFSFLREGVTIEAFVARYEGRVVAYENLCRHIPITIDYDDNRFFTKDGGHFICQTHGAIYHPGTGLCVRGPCEGASLFPLQISVDHGVIWLTSTERAVRKTDAPRRVP